MEVESDQVLKQLIFAPGFSTQMDSSDFAGRGEGLSAVADAVNQLGGTVEVDFEAGKGTCFSIRVPLRNSLSEVFQLQLCA